jgi:hypothetical protein
MALDTLKVARRLREAGFTEPQAEAVVATVQEAAAGADLATKADLKAEITALRTELKAEIAEVRTELKAEIAELRGELPQSGLRLEARFESIKADILAMKADILNRVFSLILGALVVNIVAIVGAVLAAARLVGH